MVETLLEPREGTIADEHDSVHLLGRALHRMRNMMMSVRGYAELIACGEGDRSLQQRWAERIVEQLDRLEGMHQRVDGAQARRQASGLQSLGMVVRAAVERSRQRGGGQTAVELDLTPDVLVEGEGEALREALSALLDNAFEAQLESGARTPVRVGLVTTDALSWTLTIEDAGPGLAATTDGRIGQPFFTRKPGHLGLGLFLSKTLLARHGMSLQLEIAPRGGTVATIRGRIHPSGGER